MRRKAVCAELGITRHTLARIVAVDKRFPVFFEISPGIGVIERTDLEAWVRLKKNIALVREGAGPCKDHQLSTGLPLTRAPSATDDVVSTTTGEPHVPTCRTS